MTTLGGKGGYTSFGLTAKGVPKSGPAMQNVMKMKYTSDYHFNTASGEYEWVFRANSPYDPDTALGGNSAAYFTQMANLYGSYCVHGSKLNVKYVNHDATHAIRISLLPLTYSNTHNAATLDQTRGMTGCKSAFAADEIPGQLSAYASTKQIFGVRDLSDQGYHSVMTSSPTNGWYWHLIIDGDQGTPTALDIDVMVEIVYYVSFEKLVPST